MEFMEAEGRRPSHWPHLPWCFRETSPSDGILSPLISDSFAFFLISALPLELQFHFIPVFFTCAFQLFSVTVLRVPVRFRCSSLVLRLPVHVPVALYYNPCVF